MDMSMRPFIVFTLMFLSIAFAGEEDSALRNDYFDLDEIVISDPRQNAYNDEEQITESLPSIWVANMFYRALSDFTVRNNVGTAPCQKQTETYVGHLKNNTYWAVKMYDSWSRHPNGILTGNKHQMGKYNQCIDVHIPVQGKYCMAEIKLSSIANRTSNLKTNDSVDDFELGWNEILRFIDLHERYRSNEVNIGICIPESCSAENLKISLQDVLDNFFLPYHVRPQIKVEPILCSTDKNAYPYDLGYFVTRTIMYLVFIISFLSTFYHSIAIIRSNEREIESSLPKLVYCFSIIHNGKNLVKYDKHNDLNILNGIMAVITIQILFGHKLLFYNIFPSSYTMSIEMTYKMGPEMSFLSIFKNYSDPFFYTTGFLMYVTIKSQILKRGKSWLKIPMIIFYKYLRIIPAYGIMMLLTMYFIPFMYDGPFWASKMWPEADKCRKYWWANVLGISNFIDIDNQCLVVGWYISCFLQFLVIGTIITYIYAKNQQIGMGIISILICSSLIVQFILTTQSYDLVKVLFEFFEKKSNFYEAEYRYSPYYMRSVSFYLGLMAGVTVDELKNKKIKPSQCVVFVWTVIIIVVFFSVQYYGVVFYERHIPHNVLGPTMYASLSHCTWIITLFWITVCHFTFRYGPVEKVFNNRLMTIFGRLSFTVCLVNIPMLLVIDHRRATLALPVPENTIDRWIIGSYRSYAASLILHLFVEAPFNMIIKMFFFGRKNDLTIETNLENVEQMNFENDNLQNISQL